MGAWQRHLEARQAREAKQRRAGAKYRRQHPPGRIQKHLRRRQISQANFKIAAGVCTFIDMACRGWVAEAICQAFEALHAQTPIARLGALSEKINNPAP